MLTATELTREVDRKSRLARESGALVPIGTRAHLISDSGFDFIVRVAQDLKQKSQESRNAATTGTDPFMPPYEPDLYVGELSPSHVALLNKYNVIDRHLLLITREDRPQTELLNEADFDALIRALNAIDGLAFYNGGPEAGASQPHKHLQIVPLPLTDGDGDFPLQSMVTPPSGEKVIVPDAPFPIAVSPMPTNPTPADLKHRYLELWRALGRSPEGNTQPEPYNLLATRDRMWLVPRARGEFEGLGVNALGYAGALLVRDDRQLEALKAMGPMTLLTRLTPAGSP